MRSLLGLRFPFSWRAAGALALVLAWPAATPVWAATQDQSAASALAWLRSQQAPDGSVPGFSQPGATADGVFAIVAGGQDPDSWSTSSTASPVTFLAGKSGDADCSQVNSSDCNAALAGKVAVAAKLSLKDPANFGGADLLAGVDRTYDLVSGAYRHARLNQQTGVYMLESNIFDQAFAFLALAGAGRRVPDTAVGRLQSLQGGDGGWEFSPGWGADTNSTSMAVQALSEAKSAGAPVSSIQGSLDKGLEFLAAQQSSDGGFPYQKSSPGFCDPCASDPNSTALSIQAIRSAGADPGAARWKKGVAGPAAALLGFQTGNGSFAYTPGAEGDGGSTSQAVPGVVERSFVCLLGGGTCPPAAVTASQTGPDPTPSPTAQQAGQTAAVSQPGAAPPAAAPSGPAAGPAPTTAAAAKKDPAVRSRTPKSAAVPAAAPSPSAAAVETPPAPTQAPAGTGASPTPKSKVKIASEEAGKPGPGAALVAGTLAAVTGGGVLVASVATYIRRAKSAASAPV